MESTCILCGRQTLGSTFCSSGCEISALTAAKGAAPMTKDFVKFEAGDMGSEEVATFLGEVVRCGLHEKLQRRYAIAAKALMDTKVIAEDGTVDLKRLRELKGK